MEQKVAVITGATSGIGAAAAESLARQGARILFIARDRARGSSMLAKLQSIAPAQNHVVHYADLSRIGEMKRVAMEITGAAPQIDILINNAGLVVPHRILTEDQLELTFAVNHMACFVLTCKLLKNLSPSARIISTSSAAHSQGKLDFDDLQLARGYSARRAYGNSKLCNILFTRELARKLAGSAMSVNCFHPGFVATNFGADMGGVMSAVFTVAKLFALTPEKGAETMIYLASSSQAAGTSGAYFYKCRPIEPKSGALEPAAAQRLWEVSSRLAAISV